MLKLFTYPSSIESKKVKDWLDANDVSYEEISLYDKLMTLDELKYISSLTDFGADELIAPEYESVIHHLYSDGEISLSELYEEIRKEPTFLKLPILYDEFRLLIGYDDKELHKFLPGPSTLVMKY